METLYKQKGIVGEVKVPVQKEQVRERNFAFVVSMTGAFCALAISPNLNFEPINLVKLAGLVIGASYLLPQLLTRVTVTLKSGDIFQRLIILVCGLFLVTLLVNLVVHINEFDRVIFGVFGRNNGILSYTSLMIVFSSALVLKTYSIPILLRAFHITGNIVLGYAVLQLLDLDPIDWSAEGPFSTLGNLNFSAVFMAMHASGLIVRLFLDRKMLWQTKMWFGLIVCIEVFVIWKTTSIQGLAIVLIVASLLGTRLIGLWRRAAILPLLLLSMATGLLSVAGSLGFGPLSILRQETMLFRLDYWSAGISMIVRNPMFGLGMDSYGEYYREYRNVAAATRNYFDRTANTAHNIPIDVGVGAGIFALFCFLLLLSISALYAVRYILFSKEIQKVLIGAVAVGFIFQQFVSINQIGIAVWGWIFLGLVLNSQENHKTELGSSSTRRQIKSESNADITSFYQFKLMSSKYLKLTLRLTILLVGVSLALIPLINDLLFMKASRQGDLKRQWEISQEFGGNQYLMEYSLRAAVAANDPHQILAMSVKLTESYPRSFYGWSIRAGLIMSSLDERKAALDVAKSLDPLNSDIPDEPIQS